MRSGTAASVAWCAWSPGIPRLNLAGVPEAHRIVKPVPWCPGSGLAAVLADGHGHVLNADLPLVRAALSDDGSRQPGPAVPAAPLLISGAREAHHDGGVFGEYGG